MNIDAVNLVSMPYAAMAGIGAFVALLDIVRRRRDLRQPLESRVGPRIVWWPGQLSHEGGDYVRTDPRVLPRPRRLFGRWTVVPLALVSAVGFLSSTHPADRSTFALGVWLGLGYVAIWIVRWSLLILTWPWRD